MAALKYTSDDAPDAIAEFYRRELAAYGPVTLCRGDMDFDARFGAAVQDAARRAGASCRWASAPRANFRLASVKPRGSGSEFAVVYVRASNDL